jgi:hypothetical protein
MIITGKKMIQGQVVARKKISLESQQTKDGGSPTEPSCF